MSLSHFNFSGDRSINPSIFLKDRNYWVSTRKWLMCIQELTILVGLTQVLLYSKGFKSIYGKFSCHEKEMMLYLA